MKKYMPYILPWIWIFAGILMCPTAARAAREAVCQVIVEDTSYEVTNPLYDRRQQSGNARIEEHLLPPSGVSVYSLEDPIWSDDSPYDLEQIETLGNAMREAMVRRDTSFTTEYETLELIDSPEDLVKTLFSEAVKHTGVAGEGDYLMWQYASYRIMNPKQLTYGLMDENGDFIRDEKGDPVIAHYAYRFDWELIYYTDASMERMVDERIHQLIEEELPLKSGRENDIYNIGIVYDYICSHVTYDHENLNNTNYKEKYTAYAALFDGKAVCQGYSNLMYRILLELGIDCRLISGRGDGEAHGWNIVKVGNLYYDVDATWDAGKDLYSWYLKGERDFTRHLRDREYRSDAFHQAYPTSYASFRDTCEHEYVDIHRDVTCRRDGCDLHLCIYCRDGEQTNLIPADPEAHHFQSLVTHPACLEGGYTTHTCEYCQYTYRDEETSPTGHIPGTEVKENLIPATLNGEGSYDSVVYCAVCGGELVRNQISLPKLETYYQVHFDANGGKGSMKDMELTYSQKKKLTANAFTKTGYSFSGWQAYREVDKRWYAEDPSGFRGWYTKAEIKKLGYTCYVFKNKASIRKLTGYTDVVITMKAQWKANTYTLVFKPNKGTGTMKNQKFTYGVEKKIRASAFARKGYKFAGWKCYRESDGKWYTTSGWKTKAQIKAKGYAYKLVSNKAAIKKSSPVNGDRILCYAQWKK